jgi:hypothetical protein
MELKILKLSNGERLVSALKNRVIINDNGIFKFLNPSSSLFERFDFRQIPEVRENGVTIIKNIVSKTAETYIKSIEDEFNGEVKVITNYTNLLLLKGITRVLQEDSIITPDGEITYKNNLFIGFN